VSLGEACVLIGHDAANELLLASLERRGLSVRALMHDRQLQVASVRSSADGLLLEVDARIKEAVHRGMPAVRLLGNLNWEEELPAGRLIGRSCGSRRKSRAQQSASQASSCAPTT
jgi:hypothetical protein